jgi:tRNA(fMet)-specific endonuclease VapC
MSRPFGLLDTSTVIRVAEFSTADLPEEPYISAITLAELAVGPLVTKDGVEQAARIDQLQRASTDYGEPLVFDENAARAFASVAAQLRRFGGKKKARSFDALIAATAKANSLPLFTCNGRDFRNIVDLDLVELGD